MVPETRRRRILYYAAGRARFEAFALAAHDCAACEDEAAEEPALRYKGTPLCFCVTETAEQTLAALRDRYVHLLLLDLRGDGLAAARGLLAALDDTRDLEARYGFHRILALLDGAGRAADDAIAGLGAMGVGRVLRQGEGEPPASFAARVLDEARDLILHRDIGKTALCASGGGITGIYFELGALKALDDCLGPGAVNRFDMSFGISAGAVVTGLLSVGYSVDEIMASIAGEPGGRMPPLSLRLFRLSHLNYPDLRHRAAVAARAAARVFVNVLRGEGGLESLLLDYSDIVSPPFRSDQFEVWLRGILGAGGTNAFADLPRPLFVGASDQDTHEHVLFGDEEHRETPISRAIQASLSFAPAFTSVAIEGRYYEDGAVTRTSNFVAAIERGARLLFILDPFVPYVSPRPGVGRQRGLLYNIDQTVRTISYTRFENTRNWVLRQHPEVSSYTFLPSNRARRLLSMSPMDHRPYLPIWQAAYLSTLARVQRVAHRLRGDLAVRGLPLDLARPVAVAARLRAAERPRFEDFFPDGRVALHRGPLVWESRVSPQARGTTPGPTPSAPRWPGSAG